jgi:hypothetical protein
MAPPTCAPQAAAAHKAQAREPVAAGLRA